MIRDWWREYGQHLSRVNIAHLPFALPLPSMRPRIVHRFFEYESSPLFRHTSVFGCMGRCGEYLSPGAAWHKAYCMCSKYTIGPGRERQGSLPSPMVFALSIGFNGFTARLRAHGLMRIVEKKFTRYLAILSRRVKLNKSFFFFFYLTSRDKPRHISCYFSCYIWVDRNFFYRRLRKINDGFGEHFELIN